MGKQLQKIRIAIGVMVTLLFGIITNSFAQQATISGTVTDAGTSSTMPGVNILVKGTSTGTSTDVDGKYELSVSSLNDTLVVSFIGYQTQNIPIGGREQIDIQLTPAAVSGEEVVVTALGINRNERHLGYSVTNVGGEDLAEANAMNPVEALQGKAAGIDISSTDGGMFGGSKFSIRGASTLDPNNMPIFVVDGVILQNETSGGSEWSGNPADWGNQLRNLNPDNFQSVSILKGAAATALYGSRAINGAVVIETKDGGQGNGIGIQVSQTTGMKYVYDTPDLQNEFGPGTIAGYVSYGEQDANGDYHRFDTGQFNYRDMDGQQVPSLIGASTLNFGPRFDSQNQVQGYDEQMTSYQAYPNNWKNAYDTGLSSRTNITLSGAADKLSFYVNSSIDVNKGIYPAQQLNKYSGMLKASYDFTDYLTVRGSMNYTRGIPQNPPENFGDDFTAYAFNRAYSTEKYKNSDVYIADHGGVPSTTYNDEYAYVPGNSLWFSSYKNNSRRVENTWRPILSVTADVTDWLSMTLEGNMNVFEYTNEVENLGQGYRNEGGYYELSHHYEQQESVKLTTQITQDYGDFGFDATVGGEVFHTKTSESGSNTEGGLIVPGRYFLDNSKDLTSNWAWVGQEKQISSLYALLSFSWKDQLFMDVTGRNDWSSALVYADGAGDYSFFYPSVSASWIFNETLNLPDWVSFGKLRASWAHVGNDTDPYSINQGFGIGNIQTEDGLIYTNNFNQRVLISPDLSPEQKRSYEVGANIQFLDRRLGLDVTWYKENTYDQILNVDAPLTSGVTAQKINAGNIQNQGVEVSLNATPVRTSDFDWDMTVNYTRNRNKIISLHEDVGAYQLLAGSPAYGNYRIGSAAYVGGDYGVLLSDIAPARYQATNESGEPVEDPKNGMKILNYDNTSRSAFYKRSGDVQKVGSTQPDFLGSVSNTFRYKNLSLSFLIDGRFGGHVASFTNRYGTAWGFLESSTKNLDADHGGMTWTSEYSDTQGRTYDDGVIPEGVFAEGTVVTTPQGGEQDVSGMTFNEAYEAGYVEPSHASSVTYFNNSWGNGTINDTWFYELSYVSLRQLGVSYRLPVSLTQKLGVRNLTLGLKSRNVLYLYNSSPNNMNPETFRGNRSDYSYFERTPAPFSRSIFFTLDVSL
ncbi:SusC/RagA family TonB-linked outer membrane protein [Fodinibius salsisoli]|uniref:SusC/RagA family TonB-linked outer membrane protein n=1 Tax=Fodinibius salsisoli TaxID=2820877 RepID=A0ABT3PPY4_9BACT|nr:SusC/RagA family TonB-linked outer membrane protein [Fodinibius salsisoli]MCW9707914.1 SusC/RagA family TonB-linked outer membrane protein [Fodinibius salsisoli]